MFLKILGQSGLFQGWVLEILEILKFFAIKIDSVFRADKNYYPYVFLKECKYGVWKKDS